jgi:hypothetical protein
MRGATDSSDSSRDAPVSSDTQDNNTNSTPHPTPHPTDHPAAINVRPLDWTKAADREALAAEFAHSEWDLCIGSDLVYDESVFLPL